MKKLTVRDIAYVRSGDKGDVCTAGLIAKTPQDYPGCSPASRRKRSRICTANG
ncbi:AtuA-related protein [Diaphorobacter aerolatus]|uniref:AtuA-related protein n=1 Tax=Diaphorobacter aerolatus TaxID=1288495 RepID=UPI001D030101|nr:hypothetical protein [Diaphorobacter aerolatus]